MGILRIFSFLYNKTILWSAHQNAPFYLAAVSFAESSFFPIPPDVMLLSMGLAKPAQAWRYALITTLFSVLGSLLGYIIGYFGIELLEPIIKVSSYAEQYNQVAQWFKLYGIWIILLAGFTPLPYKLFTITAGAMIMPIVPFIIGSLIGRGMRFYLVSGIMYFAGDHIQHRLRRYVDVIGWSTLIIFVFVYFILRWKS